MGDVGLTVEVSLQDVPAHLIVKRVAELCWHLEEEERNRNVSNVFHVNVS